MFSQDVEIHLKTEPREFSHVGIKQEILPNEIVESVYSTPEVSKNYILFNRYSVLYIYIYEGSPISI